MVVKVYISGISGNKEVKKRQQRVAMILESKHIDFVMVDITEPGKEQEKEYMQQNSNSKDAKYPLPPQMFHDEAYCGDYDEFDLANENDELEKFLKVAASVSKAEIILNKSEDKMAGGDTAPVNGVNGNTSSRENSAEKEAAKVAASPAPVAEERRTEEAEERTEEEEEAEEEEEEEGASEQ